MHELTSVNLENDMDIILAHRRSMKLGELAGLSLVGQTTFATAVSEICRYGVDFLEAPSLHLYISLPDKMILASIKGKEGIPDKHHPNLNYARKLADRFIVHEHAIETGFRIPGNQKITEQSLQFWANSFSHEYPLSPYDEIKRKNIQLQQLSEKLRESELQYKQLSEAIPLMIFKLNGDGQVLYANPWLLDFTGSTLEELRQTRWMPVMYPDDWERTKVIWENESALLQPLHFQYRLLHKATGEYVWHMASAIPIKDNHGNASWIGYAVNINNQKLIEQTLKDNKELKAIQAQLKTYQTELEVKLYELNQSNLELAQFAYVASHDLQEPLRKLMVYSDYLQKKYAEQLDLQGITILNSMIGATTRMKQLIEDLLLFSRISAEQQEFSAIDLGQLLREVMEDFDIRVQEKNVQLKADNLPLVFGSAQHLKQVFANLVSNSIKYSKEGDIPEITITAEQGAQDITIFFSDNGIGFEEKYADKIFGMFQRLHTRDEFEGTGIGLSIAKKIIDMHKGTITASSEPGKGAMFIISLPNAVVEEVVSS
jgi:PAS domain S-box-containing protein